MLGSNKIGDESSSLTDGGNSVSSVKKAIKAADIMLQNRRLQHDERSLSDSEVDKSTVSDCTSRASAPTRSPTNSMPNSPERGVLNSPELDSGPLPEFPRLGTNKFNYITWEEFKRSGNSLGLDYEKSYDELLSSGEWEKIFQGLGLEIVNTRDISRMTWCMYPIKRRIYVLGVTK
jgi:hypothetical protein